MMSYDYKLAKREEKEILNQFGKGYVKYVKET
jgi:protein-S-isoprenylcysteine O-methyltransferase Ste14